MSMERRFAFRWWIPVLTGMMALLLVAGGCSKSSASNDEPGAKDSGAKVEVPAVTGKPLAEARSTLEGAGFVVGEVKRRVETKAADIVLEQTPAAGAAAAKGDTVNLVATDESLVLVPALDGKSETEARALLAEFLGVDRVEKSCVKNRNAANTVYETNPRSGNSVARGTKLTLRVKDDCVELPQFIGMQKAAAMERLNTLGLLGSPSTGPAAPDATRNDTVESQSPDQGDLVAKGSTVRLRVFDRAPAPPPPPPPPPPAPVAITGLWAGNDGGTYAVRQIGNEVWWYGQDGTGGKNWTNVFHGHINGRRITGDWADVPVGNIGSSGVMTIDVNNTNSSLTAVSKTGGFGGSVWSKLSTPAGRNLNTKPASQWPQNRTGISGVWRGNDGGSYAIRQVGSDVWWYGQDGAGGRSWTNVFHGRISGSQIVGSWADIPIGNISGSGAMTLKTVIVPIGFPLGGIPTGISRLEAVSKTGGFGGSVWTR